MFEEQRAQPVRVLKALLKLSQEETEILQITVSFISLQNSFEMNRHKIASIIRQCCKPFYWPFFQSVSIIIHCCSCQ